MNRRAFLAYLQAKGAQIQEGSKHTKVRLGDKRSVVPRHKEINNITAEAIKKQLGIQ